MQALSKDGCYKCDWEASNGLLHDHDWLASVRNESEWVVPSAHGKNRGLSRLREP